MIACIMLSPMSSGLEGCVDRHVSEPGFQRNVIRRGSI